MNKTTYFCDHCGKEIKQDEHGQFEGLIDVKFDFPSTDFDATLCDDCYNELLTLVDEFLRGEDEKTSSDTDIDAVMRRLDHKFEIFHERANAIDCFVKRLKRELYSHYHCFGREIVIRIIDELVEKVS